MSFASQFNGSEEVRLESASVSLENLRRDFYKAAKTDYVMPLIMPYLPALLVLAGVAVMVIEYFLYGLSLVGLLIMGLGPLVNIYVVYKWIKRRNDHFARSLLMLESLHELISEVSKKRGGVADAILHQVDRDLAEMRIESGEKGPVLWAILQLVVPLVVFYVAYFLNKDFVDHFKREAVVLEEMSRAVKELGVEKSFPEFSKWYRFPERNIVLYVVLYVLTMGLFWFYWLYTLTNDPNQHFREHQRLDSELLSYAENFLAPLAQAT